MHSPSKLDASTPRVPVPRNAAITVSSGIFRALGCRAKVAEDVATHLADASLSGVESHGVMRVLQYAAQFQSGVLDAKAQPTVSQNDRGATVVSGGGGIGIPTMRLAFDHAINVAREAGLAVLGVRDVGHTGRHGAFAEHAAEQGFLTILTGGGNRQTWRQVAPHGGARAILPTNPWCVGIPGGALGPVVMDFATAQIAGGWIYAAQSAGVALPEGAVIDREGHPTRDPQDYFDGGAILPFGGHKGYAMALVAELIGEAMLGPATTECNWLLIVLDATRFRAADQMSAAAEDILAELRSCPPAPGFDRVDVPGERERRLHSESNGIIMLPQATRDQIRMLARSLDVPVPQEF